MNREAVEGVARAVLDLLDQGLDQGPGVLEYLETVHGPGSVRELAGLLEDRDSAEAAPLAELLFSPGPGAMAALEPALEAARLDPAGTEALVARVCASPRPVRMRLPGIPELAVQARPQDLEGFVRRLRPACTPPRELVQILDRRLPLDAALAVRVRMRHAGLAWTGPRQVFLSSLAERLEVAPALPDSPRAVEVLDWVLAFLGQIGPGDPPLAALAERSLALASRLRQAEAQEAALARGGFELMAMLGQRLPHAHPASLRRELILLDQAHRTLTGRGASGLDPVLALDLGVVEEAGDLPGILGSQG